MQISEQNNDRSKDNKNVNNLDNCLFIIRNNKDNKDNNKDNISNNKDNKSNKQYD